MTALPRKRIAVLISGRGSNMRALVEAAQAHDYPAEIALVLSNQTDAAGLTLAEQAGVRTAVLDHRPFGSDRPAFERALQSLLDEHRIDLVCLGGFMRLFTAEFVRHWHGRMLNVHPSLLPSFKGLDPHGQALRAGVRIAGATVHFVTAEMDSGPIVAQAAVPVHEDDTAQTLAARVLEAEHRVYPLALRLVAQGRVRIEDARCAIAGTTADAGSLIVPSEES